MNYVLYSIPGNMRVTFLALYDTANGLNVAFLRDPLIGRLLADWATNYRNRDLFEKLRQ
jgi:hypothetical protein